MSSFKIALLGILLCSTIYAQDNAKDSSLEQSNQNFRLRYQQAKEVALSSVGPIIIAKGDDLILLYNQQRTEVHYMPKMYHQLKAVDHIPLMLYVLLTTYTDNHPYTADQKAELEEILHTVEAISKEPSLDEMQKTCLIRTSKFLQQLLDQGLLSKEQNASFFRELAPVLLENAKEAAFLQLDALHQLVQTWKKQIPTEDWNRLAVVVTGASMPRIGEVTMQYFARLTGKQMEILGAKNYPWITQVNYPKSDVTPSKQHRRLVYAENIFTEEGAINLLATTIIDEEIGKAFFDDNMRMHCDLLAESASKRLQEKCDQKHEHKQTVGSL